MNSSSSLLSFLAGGTLVLASMASMASAGCSPARIASTETTAARVTSASASQEDVAAPAAREASSSSDDLEAPPGQLVCRTKSKISGTTELYLGSWGEEGAQGFIRTLAPSGMVYTQRVHAERYKDAIVVDEPGNTDLACHSAIVAPQNGKQYLRVGGAEQPWSACE